MELQDRGSMKWVSLMLPEHVEKLRDVFVERKVKPLLDEQKMNEMDRVLKEALLYGKVIQMTYYTDGEFARVEGVLARIDQRKGFILLCDEVGTEIPLGELIDVQMVDLA